MTKTAALTTAHIFASDSDEFFHLAAFGRCGDREDRARGEEFLAALGALAASVEKPDFRKSDRRATGARFLCGKYGASKIQ